MKKKILSLVLASAIMLSSFGISSTNVHAEGTLPNSSIETATDYTFGTEKSVTWGDDMRRCYVHITLPEDGVLDIHVSKLNTESLGLLTVKTFIHNEEGDVIWNCYSEDDAVAKPHIYVGLAAGTYYFSFEPEYTGWKGDTSSTYNLTFTPNAQCEQEANSNKETATEIEVDKVFTGYLGSGFANTSNEKDENDVFVVYLKKGHVYKYSFSPKDKGTTIVKLQGRNTSLTEFWPSDQAENFCMAQDKAFIAPYTGEYYLHIFNYGNDQYKYTTKVVDITPLQTKLTSVKASNKAFTAKWDKVMYSGYQLQYSTSKNFKKATSVYIDSPRTLSKKVSKLSSKKTYYVRVRAYKTVEKRKAYGKWSNVKSVKVK